MRFSPETKMTASKFQPRNLRRASLYSRGNARGRQGLRATATASAQQGSKGTQVSREQTSLEGLDSLAQLSTATLTIPNARTNAGKTTVYILAMSHVSAASCEHIRQLIRSTKPDVVLLELCKDRLGLLATPPPPGPFVWHCPVIQAMGVPDTAGHPTADQLQSLLTCRPGRPFTTEDIEADARALLATGLFRSVQPNALPGRSTDAPLFVVSHEPEDSTTPKIETVSPFHRLEFLCTPRALPPVTALRCRVTTRAAAAGAVVEDTVLHRIEHAALDDMRGQDARSVDILMATRARLREAAEAAGCRADLDVLFSNVENGDVEAVVTMATGALRTGLEGSASGGDGFGIEKLRNMRREGEGVKVGLTSRVPVEVVERIARKQAIEAALGGTAVITSDLGASAHARGLAGELAAAVQRGCGRNRWRSWSWKERAAAAEEDPEPQPRKDQLAAFLTGRYSALQKKAAEATGVDAGEAWRVALEEAVRCGTAQVLLGDRPALVTQRRLAQGIWSALFPPAAGALALLNLSVLAGSLGFLDQNAEYGVLGAVALGLLATAAPVALPFVEAWRFSRMSSAEIEEAVAMKEPVGGNLDERIKVWGEDALLGWPGAQGSVIDERDTYMARALAAAAQGMSGQVPAFVLDQSEGLPVLRYMMAEGAPNKAAPTGRGDGAYTPLEDADTVVAIVGSAHVRGMCKAWKSAQADQNVADLLES